MAEVKTRILLRSDIASNWSSVNPKLLRGEVGICYDPSVDGEGRKIKFKIGDGAKNWNDLSFVADYDAKIAEIDASINDLSAVVNQEVARLDAALAKKVDKEVVGDNGKAYIFNERDGGGAKFVHNDGTESFVGVNDGGEDGLMAQIYADKLIDGKWYGAKLDVTNDGIYYTVGDKSFADRAVPENELVVKGDLDVKQDKLPDATQADTFLRNDGEGNLSWVKFEIGSADWGHIGGHIEDQTDLMTKFNNIESEIADRYTKSEIYTKTETETKIADAIAGIKHWTYKVVDVLPTPSKDCEHIIYLVPKGSGKTGYKEYVCINEGSEESPVWKFEEIGDTDIDLSEYRKAAAQDTIDNEIKGLISDEEDRAKGQEEALGSQLNGVEERVETLEGKVEDLEGDSHTHSNKDELDLIGSGDVAKWNAKQDAISVGDGLKFTDNKIELDFTVLDCGDASDWAK